jgi:hypothetical protein
VRGPFSDNVAGLSPQLWYKNPPLLLGYKPHQTIVPLYMTRMSTLLQFSLPDPAAEWPWHRMLNCHYQETKPESDSWIRGFEVLDVKSQKAFDFCDFREQLLYPFVRPVAERDLLALLSALGYPLLDKGKSIRDFFPARGYHDECSDCLRVSCDLMVLFFIFDEFTDKDNANGARTYADLVMDVLRNPHVERPSGESKLGEITRQYAHMFSTVIAMAYQMTTFIDSGCVRSASQVNLPSDVSFDPSPHMYMR